MVWQPEVLRVLYYPWYHLPPNSLRYLSIGYPHTSPKKQKGRVLRLLPSLSVEELTKFSQLDIAKPLGKLCASTVVLSSWSVGAVVPDAS